MPEPPRTDAEFDSVVVELLRLQKILDDQYLPFERYRERFLRHLFSQPLDD